MTRAKSLIHATVVVLLFASGLAAQKKTREAGTIKATELSNANLVVQTIIAPKITAVRAQLFYDASGTFSGDILSQRDLALFNTIIGEGSAGQASTSTFVTVEISGRNLPVGVTKVEITATGNKARLIQRKLIGVDIYDQRTKFFAPFWLYETGCEEIKISARLIGKGAPATVVTKRIPFVCGE
jgi:hypothetical protein